MQIRKLANALLTGGFCFFSFTLMSFTDNGRSKTGGSKKDSTASSKDFKDVFSSLHGSVATDDGFLSVPLNPNVISFVTAYLKREGDDYKSMKRWGKSYFDLFDKVLAANNIPCQLKYLSVIESSLQPSMVSSAGAVGPWQLMPDEAKRYGLRTGRVDDRKDFTKSTLAAAKLLTTLYNNFGDWLLVIAAYNAGEGRVRQAIRKAGSTNFWVLQSFLPAETRNHVKKFIATHYYFEGCGGIATMTAEEIKNYIPITVALPKIIIDDVENTATVEIQGRYNSTIMAKYLQLDEAVFNRLNPHLDETLNKGAVYILRLPTDKMPLFEQSKKTILKESVQLLLLSANVAESNAY